MSKEVQRIGVILNNLSLRSDIRLFINELAKRRNVVLFGIENDLNFVDNEELQFRNIKINQLNTTKRIYNFFLKKLYSFFGNLPKEKKYYFNYKARSSRKYYKGNKLKLVLLKDKLRSNLPQFLDFNSYLKKKHVSNNKLDDISYFISFTNVIHEDFIAEIIQKRIKIYTYVHSWDHITKLLRYSNSDIKYIVWNKELKIDLNYMHNIPKENIMILGASQFYFIKNYLDHNSNTICDSSFRYLYMPLTWGYELVAKQELELVLYISDLLYELDKNVKLMIRFYPLLSDWSLYDEIKQKKNIIFDTYRKDNRMLLDEEQHLLKSKNIENALAIIHTGTTIGLEASYFDTPVIYLNLKDFDYKISEQDKSHIFFSWNQFHLKRFYYLQDYKSVIRSKKQLRDVLMNDVLKESKKELMHYNYQLRNYSKLFSIEEFTKELLRLTE